MRKFDVKEFDSRMNFCLWRLRMVFVLQLKVLIALWGSWHAFMEFSIRWSLFGFVCLLASEIIKLPLVGNCYLILKTQVMWLKIFYIMEVILFLYFGFKNFCFSGG